MDFTQWFHGSVIPYLCAINLVTYTPDLLSPEHDRRPLIPQKSSRPTTNAYTVGHSISVPPCPLGKEGRPFLTAILLMPRFPLQASCRAHHIDDIKVLPFPPG